MTMANLPALVLVFVAGVGLFHLVVAGVSSVVGRHWEEPVTRRIGRSLAVGPLGTVLLYGLLVALWITIYESNRDFGTTVGLVVLFSTPLSPAFPSFLGTSHYVYGHAIIRGR